METPPATPQAPAPSVAFEAGFVEAMRDVFEQRVAFNRLIGLELTSFDVERPTCRIRMRPELIGHFLHHRLHGGAISAAIDAAGGFGIMLAIAARHMNESIAERAARFAKLGTIDLRVDYLRPATGPHFDIAVSVLRLGSRVASTRMDMVNSSGIVVATGSGAYIVS
ncbi:MAG TPA: thioesterase family protein [Burkholderiaceae bacterium]|nr:thioesterase family protein [Burkholderiaceae bacterium]